MTFKWTFYDFSVRYFSEKWNPIKHPLLMVHEQFQFISSFLVQSFLLGNFWSIVYFALLFVLEAYALCKQVNVVQRGKIKTNSGCIRR